MDKKRQAKKEFFEFCREVGVNFGKPIGNEIPSDARCENHFNEQMDGFKKRVS